MYILIVKIFLFWIILEYYYYSYSRPRRTLQLREFNINRLAFLPFLWQGRRYWIFWSEVGFPEIMRTMCLIHSGEWRNSLPVSDLRDNSSVEFDAEEELYLVNFHFAEWQESCLLSSTVEIWNISLSLSNIFKYSHFHE